MSEDSAKSQPSDPPTVTRRVTSGSKNPTLQVTTVKLNGKNYLPWSQSFKLFVKGEGLMGYLSGTTKEPEVGDTLHPQWELENSTVMSWLLNRDSDQDNESKYLQRLKSFVPIFSGSNFPPCFLASGSCESPVALDHLDV